MVSGVFGMFFIHRKRTASLPLSETAPFVSAGKGNYSADWMELMTSATTPAKPSSDMGAQATSRM